MRVHDSQAYRKMDVTRERISRILELREIVLSIQIGFSLVNAAVACAILQNNSGLAELLTVSGHGHTLARTSAIFSSPGQSELLTSGVAVGMADSAIDLERS